MTPEYQVRSVVIDGLNLGDQIFNFKNQLLFAQPEGAHENISNAFVLLHRPLVHGEGGEAWESKENRQGAEDLEEILRVVGTFLACHSLVNANQDLEIVLRSSMSATLYKTEEIMDYAKSGGGIHTHINTHKRNLPIEEAMKSLNDTLPLFEKVTSILEKTKEGKINQLQVALLVYHQSLQNQNVLSGFLGLVTVIESLLCDRGSLGYKFALRGTLFSEPETKKRKKLFDDLDEVYRMRNKLVHGRDTAMYPYVDYLKSKQELEPIAKKILLKYIELACQGISQTKMMEQIDDIALGIQ